MTYGNLVISGAGTRTLDANAAIAGDLSITGGTFDLGSYTANRITSGGNLWVGLATFKIGGTGTWPSNFSGASFTFGSTVEYNGTNQTVADMPYSNLTLSNTGTKTFAAGTTGISGTFTISGSASAQTLTNSSTIDYNGGAQNIIVIPSGYYSLTLSNAGTKTFLSGATTIYSTFTISGSATADATTNSAVISYNGPGAQTVLAINYYTLNLTSGGTKTFAAGTTGIAGSFTFGGSATANATTNSTTISYNGNGAQTVTTITYYNLTIAKSAGTATLAGNTTINNDLSVSSGTFDLSTFTANRASAGGTLTVASGATLKIGGTNSFPSNYTTHTLSTTEHSRLCRDQPERHRRNVRASHLQRQRDQNLRLRHNRYSGNTYRDRPGPQPYNQFDYGRL